MTIALGTLASITSAEAQTVPGAEERPLPVVVVVFNDRDAVSPSPAGVDGLRTQLEELSMTVIAAPSLPSGSKLPAWVVHAKQLTRQHAALCTVWFTEQGSERIAIYLYDARTGRVLRRSLDVPSSAAAAEELAVAVRATLTVMAAGEAMPAMGVVPAAEHAPEKAARTPAPSVETSKPPATNTAIGWLLGAAYLGTSYAAQASLQHGAEFFAIAQRARVYAGLGYAVLPSLELRAPGTRVFVARHPLALLAGYRLLGGWFNPAAELALELDVQRRRTEVTDPRLKATPSDRRLRWAASPRVRGVFELGPPVQAFLLLGADVGLDRFDYVVESPGEQVRFRGRAVRPRVEAGFAVQLTR